MKKLLTILMISLFAVASCCYAADKQKVLRVGTEGAFAPFEFIDEKGQITGFDVDLIRALAEQAGYKADVQVMGFDALIPAVKTKILDCAIAGMTITEERKKVVLFTDSYYDAGLYVLVRKDENNIKGYQDLDGKRIACQIGTTGENKSRAVPGARVTSYNTNVEACMELVAKGVDAVINDAPVVAFYLKSDAGKNCKIVGDLLEAEQYGIAIHKDNPKLMKELNKALSVLRKNGTYDKIFNKWFN